MKSSSALPRSALSWALYDWANSAFATTVMAGFFPVFFKNYWNEGVEATTSTLRLGAANSLASLIIVLTAPVLGAIADHGGGRKGWLGAFAVLGCVATATLTFVPQSQWVWAALAYGAGVVGFSGGNIFYDSLLPAVAPSDRRDWVSSLGYGLGYFGGGVLFAVNVGMTLNPGRFGLSGPAEAVQWSFLSVALWWGGFSLPLFLHVREPDRPPRGAGGAIRAGLRSLAETLRRIRSLRHTFLFLVAYWLYMDAVDTIVRMALDYGISIGIESNDLIVALLITQFVGFPAALAFGVLGTRFGARRGILAAIVVYVGVVLWAYRMTSPTEFFVLAGVIGLVQGGIQALSRSFFSRLVPEGHESEFFGFFNMMGKFAVLLGPVLMGVAGKVTGSPRAAVLSLLVMLVAGGWLLIRVDAEAGEAEAKAVKG